jgi:hypothetical protein
VPNGIPLFHEKERTIYCILCISGQTKVIFIFCSYNRTTDLEYRKKIYEFILWVVSLKRLVMLFSVCHLPLNIPGMQRATVPGYCVPKLRCASNSDSIKKAYMQPVDYYREAIHDRLGYILYQNFTCSNVWRLSTSRIS